MPSHALMQDPEGPDPDGPPKPAALRPGTPIPERTRPQTPGAAKPPSPRPDAAPPKKSRLRRFAGLLLVAGHRRRAGVRLSQLPWRKIRPRPSGRPAGGSAASTARCRWWRWRRAPPTCRSISTASAPRARSTPLTVRPQVDGKLIKVEFKEGQDVRRGDALGQIDPATFQAQLDQAIAKKAQDEAQPRQYETRPRPRREAAGDQFGQPADGRHRARQCGGANRGW